MNVVDIIDLEDGSAKVVLELSYDEILLFAKQGIRYALLNSLDDIEEFENENVEPVGDPQPDISPEILDKHFGVL